MFRSIRWRIAVSYIVLIILAMTGLVVHLTNQVRIVQTDSLESKLGAEARLISDSISRYGWEGKPATELDADARRYAALLGARVTIIGGDGIVLAESDEDRATMDNHLLRPEVQQALREGQGQSIRYSRTVGYDMMYVAVPVSRGTETVGVARVALPMREVEATVAAVRRILLGAGLLIAAVAALLALAIAERTARPVRQLTTVVDRLTSGDLRARLLPASQDEVGALTRAFNLMSDRLQGTITSLDEERTRLAGILDNMADGVVITDAGGHVQMINPAAVRILRASSEELAIGLPFAQVARDHRIINLWRQCYEHGEDQSGLIELPNQNLLLQATVTSLPDGGDKACLGILRDLTQLRRLETIRRDFISNISHELRTPLASLKALAETLRDGALEDPPAARRFLSQMETEVDSLAQLVRELLELSRIESGQAPMVFGRCAVQDIVAPPVDRLRPLSERAGLKLEITLQPNLPAVMADADRSRQVTSNLVHNAIKFTPPGGEVLVWASAIEATGPAHPQPEELVLRHGVVDLRSNPLPPGRWVLIGVDDTGVGIAAGDLPRVFERFYKADRARSGGGTGLGLAIAKHVVQAHGGRIWARSVEGQGATFCVALPATEPT